MTGPEALADIRDALDRVLAPLRDVDLTTVVVKWDPTTGARVEVTTEAPRNAGIA